MNVMNASTSYFTSRTLKYDLSHNIIAVCGYLIWSLIPTKQNQHDINLKRFTSDYGSKPTQDIQSEPTCTYFHTDGKANSQSN